MRARKRSVAAAPAAPAPLLSLPAEVLHKICAQLPPHSVSALARTCRSLHAFVSADDHLWLSLYRFRWDQPDARNAARPSVCSGGEPGPSARDVPLGKGKGKAHEQPAAAGDGMAAQVWRSDEQAKRLARAAAMVQRGTSNKLALVAHYNETARALLSALHSRLARSGEPDAYNGVLPHSRTVRTFDALFGDDYEGVSAYAAWIYPREVVSTVATWQRPETAEAYANYKRRHAAHEAALRSHPPVSEGMSVRIRGSQLPAVRAVAQAHLAASTGAAARKAASQREARPVPGQRRSRRAAQAMVPEPLRPLFDHGDGSDDLPMTLEDIAPIDEQLAAELHVLHGLRELVTPARTYERGPAAGRRPCLPVLANHRLGVRASDARISVPGSVRSGSTLDDLEEAHYHRPPADARLAAPLHLLSQSGFSYGSRDAMAGDKRLRGRARRIVYSGARFGPENCFGPFLPYRPPAGANAFRVSDAGDDASDSEEEFLLEAPRVPFGSTKLSAEALGRLWEKPSEPDDAADASDNFEDNEREYSAWDTELELVDFSLGRHNGGMTAHELLHFWDDEEDDLHLFDTSPGIDEMTEGHDSQSESPDADSADGDAPPLLHPGLEEEAADYSSEESAVSSNADSSSSADSLLYPDEQDLITLAGQAAGSIPRRLMREALARGEVPEKRIDWVVVEALQVVMHANIMHAQLHGWGAAWLRRIASPGLLEPQLGAPENDEISKDRTNDVAGYNRATHLLRPPSGFEHSRGAALPKEMPSGQPYDWAHLEGVWIGTYSFLDYRDWLEYNATDAHQRGHRWGNPEKQLNPRRPPRLEEESEAVGDFLYLQLRLLPHKPEHRTEVDTEIEDEDYPPLWFEGRTCNVDDAGPTPRGAVHGVVRPVFAPGTSAAPGPDGRKAKRAISGIHFSITHRYDGEDRWKLEAVQPGPPGTRAAIYGIWSDAEREENPPSAHPNGPFAYWRQDERRWQDVERELETPRAQARAEELREEYAARGDGLPLPHGVWF